MVISSWIFSSRQLPIYKGDINRVHMHNLHPGVNLLPGANLNTGAYLHPQALRSYANKLCPYAPKFDMNFDTRYSVLRRNSLC